MVFASVCIFGIVPLLARVTGIPVSAIGSINEHTPSPVVHAALLYQFVSAAGIFLLPALLFGYFTHPRPLQYLGLRPAGKPIQWVLVFFAMLGAIPVFIAVSNWLSVIHLGDELRKQQDANEAMLKGMLNMQTFIDFLLSFSVLAVLPAISEELFFRGVMLKMAAKRNRRVFFPIFLTATIFALFHFNVYGFVSILLAGTMLGYIYYLTGSLVLSMMAHMLNNGLQIVLLYFMKDSAMAKAAMETNVIPWYMPLGGFIIFAVSFYLLWQNRTPLSSDWASDFTPEELLEEMREKDREDRE